MTLTEPKVHAVGVGDTVTYHDLGNDGYPEKWVSGIVTEVGDEGFVVQWDDFEEKGWDTEYEWANITFKGEQLID